jgi:hypothetical protein
MQHAEVIRTLEREIELNGSMRRTAEALRVSPQLLSSVLAGKRGVGPKLCRRLKLRRIVKKTVTYAPTNGHRARS